MALESDLGWSLKDDLKPIEETENAENTDETADKEEVKEEVKDEKLYIPDEDEATEVKKEEAVESKEEEEGVTKEVTEDKKDEADDLVITEEKPQGSLKDLNISELTNGEFENIEDLYNSYSSVNEKVTGKTIMETIDEQIRETYGDDITLADVVSYKATNFDEMDSFELLEHHLHLETPDISDAEIRAELRPFALLRKSEAELAEMIENEEITQDQLDDLEAKMLRQSRIAKTQLKDYQNSIDIDNLEFNTPRKEAVVEPVMSPEEAKAEADRYDSQIEQLSSLEINVGTNENPFNLKLEVSPEDRNGIRDFLKNDENGQSWINKRWMGEDGKVDMQQLSTDIYKLKNFDRSIAIGFAQGKSHGVKEEVKSINNIDFEKGQQEKDSSVKTFEDVAAQIMRENN